MFDGSFRSRGLRYSCEYLSLRLSRIGNRSVSTPFTGINVSLSGGRVSCWACAVEPKRTKAVSVMAVFRIKVSFRNNEILLGRDSSDRLRCFLTLV